MRTMQCSLAIRFLLVFALLFVQLGGAMHGIAHTLAEQQQDQTLAHDKLCDLCASYTQLGSALGNNQPLSFSVASICDVFTTTTLPCAHADAFTAFAARAPPYSI
jgi:hypothetical protein